MDYFNNVTGERKGGRSGSENNNNVTSRKATTNDDIGRYYYEDKLLQYKTICERNTTILNDQQARNETTTNKGTMLAETILARSQLLESIQFSMYQTEKENTTPDPKTKMKLESLRCLFDQTRIQLDADACNNDFMSMVDSVTNDVIKSVGKMQRDQSVDHKVMNNFDDDNDDLDDFFDAYPECIRNGWNIHRDETDDDSSIEDRDIDRKEQKLQRKSANSNDAVDVDVEKHQKCANPSNKNPDSSTSLITKSYTPVVTAGSEDTRMMPPPSNQQFPQHPNMEGGQQAPPIVQPQQQQHQQTINPINQTLHQQQGAIMNPYTRPNTKGMNSTKPPQDSSGMSSHNTNPKGSSSSDWDDHCSHNPFQTAREYAWASTDNQQDKESLYQQQQQQQQQQQPQYQAGTSNRFLQPQQQSIDLYQQPQPMTEPFQQPHYSAVYNNPYANQYVQEDKLPTPPQPPIRDSLKRKFQLPEIGATKSHTENKGSDSGTGKSNSNSSNSNVNGASSRPGSSTGNTKVKQANQNDSGSDDSELPEELRRFGKELVEKIENEIMECGDRISFDDIAGLADQKQTVQEVVCWPMKRPDLFTGLRSAPNGLLLYGPPGTGKTLIGKAIAHESGATFFSISSSSLTSKWIGEGEKLVRTLFAVAAYREPSVVFIDEIDSLLTQRKSDENEASRRIKTEFLCQLDGTGTSSQGRVLLIGATNRPQELDDAARRRFTKRLYIPLPERGDREILLRVLLQKNMHQLTETDINKLADETDGFSGADLKALSTEAAMGPIRQLGARALEVDVNEVPPIMYKHFRQALRSVRPSVSPADLDQYIEWDKTYGSRRSDENNPDDEMDE